MEVMDYDKEKKDKKELPERKGVFKDEEPILKARRRDPTPTGGFLFILLAIAIAVVIYAYPIFVDMAKITTEPGLIPPEPEPIPEPEPVIPYYQKLILLVKYDEYACPGFWAINHTRDNQSWILPIQKVKNIAQEINFVELGRYDTNNPDNRVKFNWVNQSGCNPEHLLITNNEFITMLMDLGVPVANETEAKAEPIEETMPASDSNAVAFTGGEFTVQMNNILKRVFDSPFSFMISLGLIFGLWRFLSSLRF